MEKKIIVLVLQFMLLLLIGCAVISVLVNYKMLTSIILGGIYGYFLAKYITKKM